MRCAWCRSSRTPGSRTWSPQHGYRNARNPTPLRYAALETCLNASVHLPRIGCGLAGGSWDEISPILDRTLTAVGIATTVYDLQPPAE